MDLAIRSCTARSCAVPYRSVPYRSVRFPTLVLFLVGSLLLVLCPLGRARAQIHSGAGTSTLEPDARSVGMGSAQVAIAEGAHAVWWNPANLAYLNGIDLAPVSLGDFSNLSGFEFWSYGAARPFRSGGVGLHLGRGSYVRSSDLLSYTLQAGGGVDILRLRSADDAASRRVSNSSIAVGGTIKYFRSRYSTGSQFGTRSASGSGWAADLGLNLRRSFEHEDSHVELRLGWVVRNLIDGGVSWPNQSEDDPFVRADRLGIGVDIDRGDSDLGPPLGLTLSVEQEDVLLSSDARVEWVRHAGAEVRIFGVVAGRVGYVRDSESSIDGSSFGFGLRSARPDPEGSRRLLQSLRLQFDMAWYPRWPGGDERAKHYSVGAWMGL